MLAAPADAPHRALRLKTYLIQLLLIVGDTQKFSVREQDSTPSPREDRRINEIMDYIGTTAIIPFRWICSAKNLSQ